MDSNLQRLRRQHASAPSHSNAMELAAALLRTGSLRHFRELALAGDVEAATFLRYMRSQLLGGTIFEEIEDTIEHPMFINTNRGIDALLPESRFLTKFVNVYCNKIPYAAVTVNMVDDAISVVQLLHHLYSVEDFPPPPDPVEIDQSNIARSFGHEKIMIVAIYQNAECKITVAIENQPCFNFYGDAFPVAPKLGRRDIQIRPVTEDDLESDESRTSSYKTISYEDLPDFAKPEIDGTPHYVIANLVTRGSVRDIDGPAWQDFYEPIAKVYVGYLTNYLLTQPSGWAWGDDQTYTFTCEHTALAAQAFADSLGIEEDGYIPVGAARRLEACPLAGIPQFLERRPRRSVCPECGSSVSIEIQQSRQLGLHEDASDDTPEPPTYVNQVIDFLQRLYQDEVHGDINSVLGGQDLSVSLTEGNYGPIVQQ